MRKPRKVIIKTVENYTMASDSVDEIVLRCDSYCNFTVISQKCGEVREERGKKWTEHNRVEGLKHPKEIQKAIDSLAGDLGISIDWKDAVLKIAEIDWLTAAVISSLEAVPLPPLPSTVILDSQRSLRFKSKVTVSVDWNYEFHDLEMPFRKWIEILNFEEYSVGKWAWCDGKRTSSTWAFDRTWRNDLIISYDDGGIHFEGSLESMDTISGPIIDGVDLAVTAMKAATHKKNS